MIDGPNPLLKDNRDYIETNLSINVMHSDIVVSRLCNVFHFGGINRIFGWFPGPSGACFHFNNDQPAFLFGNKIQFFVGGMPISLDNSVAFRHKVVLSPHFTLFTQFVVFSHVVCERNVLIFVHKFSRK